MPWPDHLLTLEDWDALPQDRAHRYELVEGVLLVAPRPAVLHQRAMVRLTSALDSQLPPELCAVGDVEVLISAGAAGAPATVRAPDVVIVPSDVVAANPARVNAADVLVAVEIVSPGTALTDGVTKRYEYAKAGIPGYWLVDLEPPTTLTAHVLVDGQYEMVADGVGALTVLTPVSVRVDVPHLVER